MTQKNDQSAIIYQVVRGERPCNDLSQLGITVEIVDDNFVVNSPHLEAVRIRMSDIAHGLLKYQSSPADLKKWSKLILSGSGFIDLSDCESKTGWEVLLNALWDSMASGKFSPIAACLAQELAE